MPETYYVPTRYADGRPGPEIALVTRDDVERYRLAAGLDAPEEDER